MRDQLNQLSIEQLASVFGQNFNPHSTFNSMADTVGTTAQNPIIVPDKHTGKRQEHGLATPEGTPEPDLGKHVADQAQQATEVAPPSTTKQAQPDELVTQSKPDSTEEHTDEENESSTDVEKKPATEEQTAMMEEILKRKPKDHRGILGLKKKQSDYPNQEEWHADVLKAFIERSALTHPDHIDHDKSDKANRSK